MFERDNFRVPTLSRRHGGATGELYTNLRLWILHSSRLFGSATVPIWHLPGTAHRRAASTVNHAEGFEVEGLPRSSHNQLRKINKTSQYKLDNSHRIE